MLLAIDAGNSYVKAAYHDGNGWHGAQRVALAAFCAEPRRYLPESASRVMVAEVAGSTVRAAIQSLFDPDSIQWVKAQTFACGVENRYARSDQLGADRWAALIAAHAMMTKDCVVVSLGTALTADLLTASGVFLGGVIAPGRHLMRTALAQGTAGVPLESGHVSDLPRSTADAVETGLRYAELGVVEQSARILDARSGQTAPCLLTGGGARELAPYLNRPFQVVDNLVLEGLRLLADSERVQ